MELKNERIIVSTNKKPPLVEFKKLCNSACRIMNDRALREPEYYLDKHGTKLEPEVENALNIAAKGTAFQDTIRLVSGAEFPDIVADKYYGVEVKSTKSKGWSVIGSSILESTRIADIETIFFLFGKLSKPVEFKTRRYQDCLKSIKVTHSPRYEIDMNLPVGDTIFDKMGIDYDTMRKLDNPIQPVVEYYKRQLKPGESLWWTGPNEVAPEKLKMWRLLSTKEKSYFRALGLALFPEIYGSGQNKFENFTMYLIIHYGIVSKSMRDIFTAGGRKEIRYGSQSHVFPQIYTRLIEQKSMVLNFIKEVSSDVLEDTWKIKASKDFRKRVEQWIQLVVEHAADKDSEYLKKMLRYHLLGETQ